MAVDNLRKFLGDFFHIYLLAEHHYVQSTKSYFVEDEVVCRRPGLHKLWYPSIRDTSTWSKFGAHGEHGDVFLFSNLGAL